MREMALNPFKLAHIISTNAAIHQESHIGTHGLSVANNILFNEIHQCDVVTDGKSACLTQAGTWKQ